MPVERVLACYSHISSPNNLRFQFSIAMAPSSNNNAHPISDHARIPLFRAPAKQWVTTWSHLGPPKKFNGGTLRPVMCNLKKACKAACLTPSVFGSKEKNTNIHHKTSRDCIQFFAAGCSRTAVNEGARGFQFASLHLLLASGSPGLILCIGDSLTAGGYPTLLQGLLSDASPAVVCLALPYPDRTKLLEEGIRICRR